MKALSFSRLTFVCALVLGVMVLWSAAAPSATGADSAKGGWIWVNCETPCWGNGDIYCDEDEAPPAVCTNHDLVNVCNTSGSGGLCTLDPETPCTGNAACNAAQDTHCSGG